MELNDYRDCFTRFGDDDIITGGAGGILRPLNLSIGSCKMGTFPSCRVSMKFSENVCELSNWVSGTYELLKMVAAASTTHSEMNWKSEVTPKKELNLTGTLIVMQAS